MSTYITPAQVKEKSRVAASLPSPTRTWKSSSPRLNLWSIRTAGFEKTKIRRAYFPFVDEETIPQEVTDATLVNGRATLPPRRTHARGGNHRGAHRRLQLQKECRLDRPDPWASQNPASRYAQADGQSKPLNRITMAFRDLLTESATIKATEENVGGIAKKCGGEIRRSACSTQSQSAAWRKSAQKTPRSTCVASTRSTSKQERRSPKDASRDWRYTYEIAFVSEVRYQSSVHHLELQL